MSFQVDRRTALQMLGLGAAGSALLGDIALAQGKDSVTIGWPSDVPSWDPNQRFTPDAQPIFKLVFDQPLGFVRLRETIEQRLLRFDRSRQRVVTSGGVSRWEDDPHFTLSAHLHRVALPAPRLRILHRGSRLSASLSEDIGSALKGVNLERPFSEHGRPFPVVLPVTVLSSCADTAAQSSEAL